jgi:tetratricopeptide (TPR) repeat protein
LAQLEVIDAKLSHRGLAEAHMQRGAALIRLRRFDEAERAYDTARVFTLASACAATQAEFDYYATSRLFNLGENEKAEESAYRVLSIEQYPFESGDPYFVPLAHSRARAFEALGIIEARRERYSEQSAFICRALGELANEPIPDVWHELFLLNGLAVLVADLGLDAEATLLREGLQREWPAEAVGFRFTVLRSLGLMSAIAGDHIGALRDQRAAAEFAPSPILRLLATLDRSLLARELSQSIMAREELDYAEKLSAQIDWNNSVGEDRFVLLLLAQVLADRSPAKARRSMDRYRGVKAKLPPNYLGSADRRWQAVEAFSEGLVLSAENQPERAAVFLGKAFSIWDALGFPWDAARAALELAEIQHDEPRFIEYAQREALRRPNSWLARRVAKFGPGDHTNES